MLIFFSSKICLKTILSQKPLTLFLFAFIITLSQMIIFTDLQRRQQWTQGHYMTQQSMFAMNKEGTSLSNSIDTSVNIHYHHIQEKLG